MILPLQFENKFFFSQILIMLNRNICIWEHCVSDFQATKIHRGFNLFLWNLINLSTLIPSYICWINWFPTKVNVKCTSCIISTTSNGVFWKVSSKFSPPWLSEHSNPLSFPNEWTAHLCGIVETPGVVSMMAREAEWWKWHTQKRAS